MQGRVLVTGARGQLGTALLRNAPAGVTVLGLAHADLDVGDRAAVLRAVEGSGATLIFNAAAYTAVDKAEEERALAFRINAEGAGHLAEAARRRGAKLVHVSTDYVFDGTKAEPYAPLDAPNPLNAYGHSKLEGERLARERSDGAALVVRSAWVHARDGKNFVNTMRRLLREKPEVRVVADQFGSPTHAESLARALWSLAALGATGLHHWTDDGACSWHEFAVEIRGQLAARHPQARLAQVLPIPTREYPTPARRPLRAVLDGAATRALVGPPRPWREELSVMLGSAP